jgi:hypothetical protein
MRCDDTASDPQVNRESCRNWGIGSLIAAPIVHGGSVFGLIEVFSRRSHAFDAGDCWALERLTNAVATLIASRPSARGRSQIVQTTEISANPDSAELRCVSGDAQATATNKEDSSLAGPLLPGYKMSISEKLLLQGRTLLWSVAAILLFLCGWLGWKTPTPSPSIVRFRPNPQSAEQNQPSPIPNRPGKVLSFPTPMKHEGLESVRQRAQRGDPSAQLELGPAYASAQSNRENDTEAVNWLMRSADGGNATAAAVLGAFYWNGRGVTQGYVDAYTWSAIAAAEGDEVSSYRVMILQSRMSPAELNEAKRRAAVWLRTHGKQASVRSGPPTKSAIKSE